MGDGGRAGAARVVRDLLRVAPGERANLATTVARLEVLLFVAPLMTPGVRVDSVCVLVCVE